MSAIRGAGKILKSALQNRNPPNIMTIIQSSNRHDEYQ